ncbi:hypothetical protein LOTGIDRAFT_186721 [Lottia gigantea]|uniref:Glycerate kinase n=1 Tax=Lottia gigantea TaxID=225164 RepID=V4APZ2_LOTGI|nr:hypothetical protein LOTGIDRAFT_186721 [Lottia gigantea]ESO99287.1 hypothetical protein LOTGIDRAFT_186721 [Lottia gigantea]
MAGQDFAREIFSSAVSSVLPGEMIINKVKYENENKILHIENREYSLKNNVYVVGFGKAVLGMARTVEDILKHEIKSGIVSVPLGSVEMLQQSGKSDMLLSKDSRIEVYEGAENNLPDNNSHKAAMNIHNLVKSLTIDDILLVLISGGGSSLLPSPYSPITLQEEMSVVKLLAKKAATIQQLNMIRKNIESMKGGGLAVLAQPAQVISLILSDVISDPLSDIASGPTVPDSSTSQQCLDLLQKFEISEQVPKNVKDFLKFQNQNKDHNNSCDWSKVQNVIVGSNSIATTSASEKAAKLGFVPFILSSSLEGEARIMGNLFAHLAKYCCMLFTKSQDPQYNSVLTALEFNIIEMGISKCNLNNLTVMIEMAINSQSGICIVTGGETTVEIKGTGKGGRNQEMVVSAGLVLNDILHDEQCDCDIEFLSAGTDGQDGPTDLAGAVINQNFYKDCQKQGLQVKSYLDNNDSYHIFSAFNDGRYSVKTGLTGTNVMDIQILLVRPKSVNDQFSVQV